MLTLLSFPRFGAKTRAIRLVVCVCVCARQGLRWQGIGLCELVEIYSGIPGFLDAIMYLANFHQ